MVEIIPSILSADFAHLANEIGSVERGGATMLHLDVMDGHFVSNITLGPPVVESIRKVTKAHLDCHLMIEDPERYIPAFARAEQGDEAPQHLKEQPQHQREQECECDPERDCEGPELRPRLRRRYRRFDRLGAAGLKSPAYIQGLCHDPTPRKSLAT